MTLDDFMAEASLLAKPCRLYRLATPEAPVSGYWHGVHAGGPCASIERKGQWLDVYLEVSESSGRVEVSDRPLASPHPLQRSEGSSLPPIDAIFRNGSGMVAEFLKAHAWDPNWPYNDNFKSEAARAYVAAWMRQCPLYMDDVVAVKGGWNMPWPDGDWDALARRSHGSRCNDCSVSSGRAIGEIGFVNEGAGGHLGFDVGEQLVDTFSVRWGVWKRRVFTATLPKKPKNPRTVRRCWRVYGRYPRAAPPLAIGIELIGNADDFPMSRLIALHTNRIFGRRRDGCSEFLLEERCLSGARESYERRT